MRREGRSVIIHLFTGSAIGHCQVTLLLERKLECIDIISVCSIDALLIEKLFWVVMVLIGFISVSVMLTNAAIDWIKYPTRRMYNRSF